MVKKARHHKNNPKKNGQKGSCISLKNLFVHCANSNFLLFFFFSFKSAVAHVLQIPEKQQPRFYKWWFAHTCFSWLQEFELRNKQDMFQILLWLLEGGYVSQQRYLSKMNKSIIGTQVKKNI